MKKAVKKAVPQAAKIYEKQLMDEINKLTRTETNTVKSRLKDSNRLSIRKYQNQQQTPKAEDDGRMPVFLYKRPMSKKGFFKPYEYVYDKLSSIYGLIILKQ